MGVQEQEAVVVGERKRGGLGPLNQFLAATGRRLRPSEMRTGVGGRGGEHSRADMLGKTMGGERHAS